LRVATPVLERTCYIQRYRCRDPTQLSVEPDRPVTTSDPNFPSTRIESTRHNGANTTTTTRQRRICRTRAKEDGGSHRDPGHIERCEPESEAKGGEGTY
ncbi:hypothetical protein CB0940_11420, partial [Cercospora beticola]